MCMWHVHVMCMCVQLCMRRWVEGGGDDGWMGVEVERWMGEWSDRRCSTPPARAKCCRAACRKGRRGVACCRWTHARRAGTARPPCRRAPRRRHPRWTGRRHRYRRAASARPRRRCWRRVRRRSSRQSPGPWSSLRGRPRTRAGSGCVRGRHAGSSRASSCPDCCPSSPRLRQAAPCSTQR
jgi:hypothetical protein